ncbi:MAG: calcium-binding protein [Synechococcus sp. ELA057]
MSTDLSALLAAAFGAYPEGVPPAGYELTNRTLTNAEGLAVAVYRRRFSNDFILAFRGTEPTSLADLATDAGMGWPQFKESRTRIADLINELLAENGRLEITGHSLGGALAQFAAYDIAKARPDDLGRISLTTWNALGGEWALRKNDDFDPSRVANLEARHFFRSDDLVARLGMGHVGGTTLRMRDPEGQLAGFLSAHMKQELSQSLQAGSWSAGTPWYLPIAESSQLIVANLLSGALKSSRPEERLDGFRMLLTGAAQLISPDQQRLAADLTLVLGTVALQELMAAAQRGSGELLTTATVMGRDIAASGSDARLVVQGIVGALQQWWPQLLETGIAQSRAVGQGVLTLSRAALTPGSGPLGLAAEFLLWQLDQQLAALPGFSGGASWLLALPGRPSLAGFADLLERHAQQAITVWCPLLLDLDGDGVETLALEQTSLRFDHDGDGVAERSGWVHPDDALLAWDRDGDGAIRSGAELFGTTTPLPDGRQAPHGFAALAVLDDNRDGRVDAADRAWSSLGLWRDRNSNASLDAGEWTGLSEAGIAALELVAQPGSGWDAEGNDHRLAGAYRTTGGEQRALVDVWFAYLSGERGLGFSQRLAAAAADMAPPPVPPVLEIQGLAGVASLAEVAGRDAALCQLLAQWRLATAEERRQLLPPILYRWLGVADLPTSPTSLLSDDRMLASLHVLTGWRYEGRGLAGNSWSAEVVSRSFDDLCTLVGNLLEAGSILSPLWMQVVAPEGDGLRIDPQALERALNDQLQRCASDAELIAAGQVIRSFPGVGEPLLAALRSRALAAVEPSDRRLWLLIQQRSTRELLDGRRWDGNDNELLEGGAGAETLLDAGGDDVVLGGDGDDTLISEGGNDLLIGGGGKDLIRSSLGDDTVIGGGGDDLIETQHGSRLFLFNRGDGRDLIALIPPYSWTNIRQFNNTLQFGAGIGSGMVKAFCNRWDLVLQLKGTEDSVTLPNFFSTRNNPRPDASPIQLVRFGDGGVWDFWELVRQSLLGDDSDEYLWGTIGDDTIVGAGGNDTLLGDSGNDLLQGGPGADRLWNQEGNDTLEGGPGADDLTTDAGTNTIVYSPGDGADSLSGGGACINRIVFAPGIRPADLRLSREGSDGLLKLPGGGDSILLRNLFLNNRLSLLSGGPVQQVAFQDGTLWSLEQLAALAMQGDDAANRILGLSGADTLRGEGGHDTLLGSDGDDLLLGGSGNDRLDGEAGNDRLDGGSGDDTLLAGIGEDTLQGGGGNNQFQFLRGQGVLAANPAGASPGVNSLLLPASILPTGVRLSRQGSQLQISSSEGTIRVEDFFRDASVLNPANPLQNLRFASGSLWDAAAIASRVVNSFIGGSGNDSLSGRDSDDWLDGLAGNDLLQGLAGHDNLQGGAGNDTLIGGAGNDTLAGGEGVDTASWAGVGTPVSVDLALAGPQDSGSGLDWLIGIENLIGGSGSDRLVGDAGANRIESGDGDDWVDGGAGNDTLIGGNQLKEGDTLSYSRASAGVRVNLSLTAAQNTGGAGTDLVTGFENLSGSPFADALVGNADPNRLDGGSGNDTLQGGAGADTLRGGEGADEFLYANEAEASSSRGRDLILDLTASDRINLTAIDARSDQSGNQAFSWIGGAAFTALGQLRYTRLSNGNGLLEGNCSGTLAAEFQIELQGCPDLAGGALVLL